MRRIVLVLALCLPLIACTQAPTVPMFGAFFPGWLFCIGAGIIAALLIQAWLARRPAVWLPPLVTFLTLASLFSFLFWLLFFKP